MPMVAMRIASFGAAEPGSGAARTEGARLPARVEPAASFRKSRRELAFWIMVVSSRRHDTAARGRSPGYNPAVPGVKAPMSESASTDGGPALRLRDVAKRFGGAVALDRASLELRRGERLALLGPNGAGKTTLVRCICGRAVPDAGEIEMLGELLPPTGGRQRLGFVPQEVALYPDLTARENLEAFGRFHGLRGRRAAPGRGVGAGVDRPRRPGPAADEDLLRGDEAAGQHRLRRPPPPPRAAAGRAHRGRRPPEPGAHLRDARRAARPRHLDPADHAPAGRGGAALRPHRDHRPRPRDRAGDALRADRGHGRPEAPGDAPPGRAGPEPGGLPGGRRPAGARGRGGGRGPRAAGPAGDGSARPVGR